MANDAQFIFETSKGMQLVYMPTDGDQAGAALALHRALCRVAEENLAQKFLIVNPGSKLIYSAQHKPKKPTFQYYIQEKKDWLQVPYTGRTGEEPYEGIIYNYINQSPNPYNAIDTWKEISSNGSKKTEWVCTPLLLNRIRAYLRQFVHFMIYNSADHPWLLEHKIKFQRYVQIYMEMGKRSKYDLLRDIENIQL